MGRYPVGDRAMTSTERVRLFRARHAKPSRQETERNETIDELRRQLADAERAIRALAENVDALKKLDREQRRQLAAERRANASLGVRAVMQDQADAERLLLMLLDEFGPPGFIRLTRYAREKWDANPANGVMQLNSKTGAFEPPAPPAPIKVRKQRAARSPVS